MRIADDAATHKEGHAMIYPHIIRKASGNQWKPRLKRTRIYDSKSGHNYGHNMGKWLPAKAWQYYIGYSIL